MNSLSGAIRISYLVVFKRMNLRSLWESRSLTVFLALMTSWGTNLARALPEWLTLYLIPCVRWCRLTWWWLPLHWLSRYPARSCGFACDLGFPPLPTCYNYPMTISIFKYHFKWAEANPPSLHHPRPIASSSSQNFSNPTTEHIPSITSLNLTHSQHKSSRTKCCGDCTNSQSTTLTSTTTQTPYFSQTNWSPYQTTTRQQSTYWDSVTSETGISRRCIPYSNNTRW